MSGSTPRPGSRCDCHCRPCGQHFADLESFDAHHERETPDGPSLGCLLAEDLGMTYSEGICPVAFEVERLGVLIWKHAEIRIEGEIRFAEEEAA